MIECLFSCKTCGIARVKFAVRYRGKDEHLGEWMKAVGHALAKRHAERSPWCTETKMSDLMIPVKDGHKVGSPESQGVDDASRLCST